MIVVVLSENANAAPHLEREIALAISLRRILVPFRLAETTPRPEIRFYLGKVPWVNASNPPAEEHLEALTARIKELMSGSAGTGDATPRSKRGKESSIVQPSQLLVQRFKGF